MHSSSQTFTRHTPGRYLQALAVGGDAMSAAAYAEAQGHWADRDQVVRSLKMADVTASTTDGGNSSLVRQPVGDAFLDAMRAVSVPLRLAGLRRVPMFTRLLTSDTGMVAGEVPEGDPIPVLRGDYSGRILYPRTFAGIAVQTAELMRSTSPTASAGITDDLAAATATAENRAFLDPDLPGSVLYGAPAVEASGTNAAATIEDLRTLFGHVPAHGRGGLALVMDEATALDIHLRGPSLFPGIGPMGGTLAGVPVLIADIVDLTESPSTHVVALLHAPSIFYADRGGVRLSIATSAALQMSDTPSGAAQQVSLMQTDCVATRAVRESAWYAGGGAGAYMRVSFA
jgi:HK97 family phage major capsid protein